jgi:ribonuclease Z
VVLSGDTRKSQNLVEHARGVDVLIHEVAAAGDRELEHPLTRSILAHHTTAREAAGIFRDAAPRLAVFSHIVLRGDVTERDVMRATRRIYGGKVVMGEDLMTIDVVSGKTTRPNRRVR